MLASIHPLGERTRNNRWGVTVTAYLAGSVAGAALLGTLLGGLGALVGRLVQPGAATGYAAVALLSAASVAVDLGWCGVRLPTVHRQVNEEWLPRYRGWVYGIGFGFQLGLGVVTIVTTAAIYLAFVLALLSGSVMAGAAIGATFGLVRGATILTVAKVRHPDHLRRLHAALRLREAAWRRRTLAIQVAMAGGVMALAVGHWYGVEATWRR